MKNRERFLNAINNNGGIDRLPMMEWATWWDKTLERWRSEGLPSNIGDDETREYFGFDMFRQFWILARGNGFPYGEHGKGPITDLESYKRLADCLYPRNAVYMIKEKLESLKELHDKGDLVVWITLDGFFWYPRMLFGIENHMYAFYDKPELMHKINSDLADFNIFVIEEVCKIIRPDFMTFGEDMSYNGGSMISYNLFNEFLLPYYKRVIPVLKKYHIIPLVDSDGQVEDLIPWMMEAGIEGILPLERQAGVDVARIRKNYPTFKMIGAFNKMVMNNGEDAIRNEFERLLPIMKSGGFIPSVDHQTPPGVSLKEYRIYIKLLQEYCEKAAKP